MNWRLQVIRKQQAAAQVAAAMSSIVGTCSKQTGSVCNDGWKSVTF